MLSLVDFVLSLVIPPLVIVANVFLLLVRYVFYSGKTRDFKTKNKLVVITGCDSGFGELSAHHLTKLGYKVMAACYTEVEK